MVAYTYPILNIFWSMFIFFAFFVWIWLLISIFIDIFRSPELSGFAKAAWFLFVLIIPLIGVLVYLIARGGRMHEHATQTAKQQDEAFRQYVRATVGDGSSADQLAKLADLEARGIITTQEFERQKAKVLS